MSGISVLKQLGEIKQGSISKVEIANCGQLNDDKRFITHDPLNVESMKRIWELNKYNRLNFEQEEIL